MAKRELIASVNSERDEILAKMDELEVLTANYFLKFTKTTKGQQSIGDASLDFVVNCAIKADLYPEILSANFNKVDFKEKLDGVNDFFTFKQKILSSINKWDLDAKVCKTDSMFYANKIYSIIQSDAKESVKYQPACDELKNFYKKSASDKNSDSKTTGNKKTDNKTQDNKTDDKTDTNGSVSST
jgi:hypothetical protein